jgi:hypothetical protein
MKRKHFFRFLGFAATGAGVLTGSLLLFQKVISREVFATNVTLAIGTITLLLAGAQILCVGLASERLSRTYYESQNKPIHVSKTTTVSDEDLEFRREVADRVHTDSGNHSEHHPIPSHLPARSPQERPTLMVSAHQPRVVHKLRSLLPTADEALRSRRTSEPQAPKGAEISLN